MTQKELLYVEDAIGHENTLIQICQDSLNNLQDDNLKEFMQTEISVHEDLKKNLLGALEENCNE